MVIGLRPAPAARDLDDNRSFRVFHVGMPDDLEGAFQSVGITFDPRRIIDSQPIALSRLRIGVIELGASWVPGWMRALDSGAEAFRKNEHRLQRLSLKPSELVRRQVRITPYPHEAAGWIVRNTGPEVMMFSSDYPHVEGGRHPLRRFDDSLAGCTAAEQQAFYCDNFVDFMGPRLSHGGR